ncbi:MAG: FGGY family carbohydrate kinase [Treponema sp.]|nr:FGGY family carbohydrate kinase [Treponema sp.]
MYLAGIDLGTTGCKAMVFDANGSIMGSHRIEYDLIFTPKGVEQDAALWWENAKTALRQAVKSAGIAGSKIKAVAVASQGIASVPVDAETRPLTNAISWYDSRAQPEADEIALRYGDSHLFETTGRHAGSLFFPQILHLKRTKRAVYEKAKYFLMAHDYLVFRMCGAAVTDYTMASGSLCFDTGKHQYIDEMFDYYGIDRSRFPVVKPFGSVAGKLLPAAAAELGLGEDTLAAVGMQDQKAAAVGAGITLEDGIITVSLGTAAAISRLRGEKVIDPNGRLSCHAFDSRRWITENYVGACGASLKWLRDIMFPDLTFDELDSLALKSPAGSNGVCFAPELDSKKGAFTRLSLSASGADIVRSVMEGIAYRIKDCVQIQNEVLNNEILKKEVLENEGPARELRIYGGGAASVLWRQIISEVTMLPVTVPRTLETSCLGAAVCAGMAAGLFPDETALANFIGGTKK